MIASLFACWATEAVVLARRYHRAVIEESSPNMG